MAPISEKRSQPPQPHTHVKEHGRSHGHSHGHSQQHSNHNNNTSNQNHAKENNNAKHQPKRGIEILDFHESWLEEMELYKDVLYVKKFQQQQLLAAHNQAHTPCRIDMALMGAKSSGATLTEAAAAAAAAAKSKATRSETNATTKARIIVRNGRSSAAAAANGCHENNKMKSTGVQLLLKRPRDDGGGNGGHHRLAGGSSKRHSRSHSHVHSQPHVTILKTGDHSNAEGNTVLPNSKIPAPNTANASSNTHKPTGKIIVNQFHASSLLNSHQHDEKTKILTQNGLTKSAATAYETSLYASHYLPQDRTTLARLANNEHSNHPGVTLANRHYGGADEDPSAAIDDINDYSETDSEDEYVGYPFYLPAESDTHSKHTHHKKKNKTATKETTDQSCETSSEPKPTQYYTPNCILSPSLFPNVPPYINFASHAEKGPEIPPALHRVLKWKLSPVMPKIVKRVVLNSGFRIIKNTTDWTAIWEKHIKSPGFRTIRSHQKYNHMPGSFRIGRKDSMWRNIYSNMQKFGRKEFGFMQKSYIMPEDLESLRQVWPKNASKLTKWIVKPPASARGTGIHIVNKWSQFPKDRPLVVQKYIDRPLLINDNKFDMRIYVVVTSINPLRIYMYKDGLARFASVKYSSELTSLDDRCMHLTNYSINKFSQNYSKNEDFNACQGHKWTLQSLWSCLEARGVNTKRLWATLRNLVIKAIISGESGLNRMYRQNVNFRYNCFELFGFDVLLDENLIPWLLEINISPSLHSELPLDLHVKGPLIQAVLNTALYQVPPKLTEKQQMDILDELNLKGPLCNDKRIFTTCLTAEEVRKHNHFTNRSIEFREEYFDDILENLLPDDVRCLIIAEDEYARCKPLERIFPTPDTHIYLRFIDNPRYYNRLLDAWEHRYGHCREAGISLLQRLCSEGFHLEVSEATSEKEPNVALTEIDLLHQKKSEDNLTAIAQAVVNSSAIDSGQPSKPGSPELAIIDASGLNARTLRT